MPVDVDRFEAAEAEPTTSERILRFLASHDEQAYTRREIADAIDGDPETVGTNLTRLKRRGLVRHRQPYWAFTDDRERAREALSDRYDEAAMAVLLDESEESADGDDGPASREKRGERPHRTAAAAYFRRVEDELGDEVPALYLFGSVARAEETTSSDVDVLAVVSEEADFAAVDDRLLEIAFDVQLEHDVPIEVHAIRAGEFHARRERGDPFVRGVLVEGESSG